MVTKHFSVFGEWKYNQVNFNFDNSGQVSGGGNWQYHTHIESAAPTAFFIGLQTARGHSYVGVDLASNHPLRHVRGPVGLLWDHRIALSVASARR